MEKQIPIDDNCNILSLYLKDISKESLISKEEEIELFKKYHSGDKLAGEKLVNANLRFVIKIAKQYQNRGVSLEDLIAEGNIGLLTALDKFDETRGFHFISYAVWWIRQAITKSIYYNSSDIRLPTSQIEPKTKISKVVYEFEQKQGRAPSLNELSDLTGFDEAYIRKVQLSNNLCISVDTPITNDEDNCTLGDCIPDKVNDTPDTITNKLTIQEGISKILDNFSNRDHDVICMTYGLKGCIEMSPDEISKKFALSAERIRQIIKKSMALFKSEYKNQFEKLL